MDGLRPQAITSPGESSVLEQLQSQLGEDERRVFACFKGGSILVIDALVEVTGLGAPQVSAALMMLELKKLVTKRTDGSFEAPG